MELNVTKMKRKTEALGETPVKNSGSSKKLKQLDCDFKTKVKHVTE